MPTSKNLIGINTGENIVVNDNANLEPMMAKPIKFEQTNFNQSQIAKAAFERENTAVSSILEASYQLKFDNEIDPNFDISEVVDGDIKGSKYEPYLDNFLEFKNPNQVKALKDKIDKEDENTRILNESGWTGVAWSLAAGILDPVNFIPIGGGAYKAYKAGKVAKGIALTAGAGTVGATTSEGILQATQETRTIEESAINIAGATLLAGVLGGSAAYISKRKFNNLAKKVEKDVEIETADIQVNPETQKIEIKPETTTAKNVEELDAVKKYYNDILTPQLKAEGKEIPTFADFRKQQQSLISTITQDIAGAVKGEKVLKKINLIDNLNPIQRLTQAQYATAPKEVAEKLMKTGLMWNKNKIGIASAQSAEISKKALQASYFNAYKPLEKKAFYNFQKRIKKEGSKNATEENIVKSSSFTEKLDKKLFGGSSEKFYEELSRALRNGDVSNVPEIEQLAKTARSEVISKLGKEAVNVGLLDEKILTTKPKTAESYFPRMWNKQKVIAKENELKDFLTTAIKERLLPNIKNKEANKELALNSQILDLQTKKLELENRFEKASENKANESQQNAILNEPDIPQEYKYIFQNNINRAKAQNQDLNLFSENLSNELPDSLVYTYDEIEKLYNKYIKGDALVYSTDELIELLDRYKTANKTFKNIKLKSLFTKIKEIGGINDSGGDLKAMGITNKTLPGLIRKTPQYGIGSGLFGPMKKTQFTGADDVALVLWEEGYFPEFPRDGSGGQPSSNDLFELMSWEAHGTKIYSSFDIEKVQQKENAESLINELEQLGIDFDKIQEAVKLKKGRITKKIELKQQATTLSDKIIDKKTFIKIDKALAKHEIDLLNKKIGTLKNKYSENQNAFNKKFGGIINENLYIENVVDEIISKLKGEDRLGLIDDLGIKVGSRGPLKERTLNFVQDNELEPWLENDASKVLNYYQNTLATDIEVARAFEGDLTLDNEIAKINEEYKNAKKGITDPKILKNIEKERIRVINDVDSTLKIMRGMYARPDDPDSLIVRGGRLVRQFNYITKMGQVAISSISDISNPIRKHGLATWAKTLPNLITNLKGIKLNVKEAKLAGNISDRIMPERMASFSGLGDPFASSASSFERVVDNIGKFMSKINLMPLWNDSQKSFSSVISQQRMVKAINKYDKVDEKEITYLSYLGIGRDNYQIIAKELEQYAYKEDGLWVANTEKWQNTEAVRIYRNALNTDVDSTIVSVGAGDLPLWMQTEVGKVVGQFKSFTFGATQQVLASGLQQKDMAVLNGLISATALGMMIYYFKRKLSGKELSDDPSVWINEGLDRSGYFGILAEYSHIADKVGLGFSTLSGAGQLSRYQTRSAASSLLGPSVGAVSDAFIGGSALISQEITEADAKAIRRMIPLNNTLILTKAMDNFEKSIANK
jgi:hypothetical protein